MADAIGEGYFEQISAKTVRDHSKPNAIWYIREDLDTIGEGFKTIFLGKLYERKRKEFQFGKGNLQ